MEAIGERLISRERLKCNELFSALHYEVLLILDRRYGIQRPYTSPEEACFQEWDSPGTESCSNGDPLSSAGLQGAGGAPLCDRGADSFLLQLQLAAHWLCGAAAA